MTLQINLSWWAQAILVAVIAIGVLTGKVAWNNSASAAPNESPIVVQTPKLPSAADGWTAPASDWMAQTAGRQ